MFRFLGIAMKNRLIIIGSILFIFIVFLSGCNEEKDNEKNKFIGEWILTVNNYYENGTTGGNYKFFDNDTYRIIFIDTQNGEEREYIKWAPWSIENKQVCLYRQCYEYEFSDKNKVLSLIYDGEIQYILNKTVRP
jgi:hypothetical protein